MRKEQSWDELEKALAKLDYRREPPRNHERFRLDRDDESNYAELHIFTFNPNTYRPDEMRGTDHEFVVPVATYHERQWRRWVIERIISIEVHETVENIFVDGERLYSPYHGAGWDPYGYWPEGDPVERAKPPSG